MKKIVILAAASMMLSAWGSIVISGDMMMDKNMDMKKESMDTMQNDDIKKDAMNAMQDKSVKKDKMGMSDSMKMDTIEKKNMKKDKMMTADSM